jgi:allophanate hydrolase subunit 1
MEGRIMNLSVEAKVAIAVATSFVVLMMGAMAGQG